MRETHPLREHPHHDRSDAGHSRRQLASIEWMDRQGNFTPLRETTDDYYAPAFSPDGKRLALAISDGKRIDIWVYELAHDTLTRLTFAGNNLTPIWTPDGHRITYRLLQKGRWERTLLDTCRRHGQPRFQFPSSLP